MYHELDCTASAGGGGGGTEAGGGDATTDCSALLGAMSAVDIHPRD